MKKLALVVLLVTVACIGLVLVSSVCRGPTPTVTPTSTKTSTVALTGTLIPISTITTVPMRILTPISTPVPTFTPASTRAFVPTLEVKGLETGTYLVGIDIAPGIYVGLASEGSCYWERLSGLTGKLDEILANDNARGLYYVEVLSTDEALKTACALLSIDQVPFESGYWSLLPPGTYLVGRDIEAGTYRGKAEDGKSCYWERLDGLTGEMDHILANDNAKGQYFIEVLPTDVALHVSCEVEKVR